MHIFQHFQLLSTHYFPGVVIGGDHDQVREVPDVPAVRGHVQDPNRGTLRRLPKDHGGTRGKGKLVRGQRRGTSAAHLRRD